MTALKTNIDDLAVLGGTAAFAEKLHVGRPNIGSRERFLERINGILDRRWLTNAGACVQEFERRVADLVGAKHCIAMCNATVALEITVRALELSGEVIVPSFTFIATAHSLFWQQITPVFCDVDPVTHCIDPASAERLITPRTSGIVGVHLWGRPCDIERLSALASRHELKLIFDAAHAFGCSHEGRMVGTFGEAEVFSFHATKFFNTGEGGAVTTNNDELAHRIRLMKNFGFMGYDNVVSIGTNGKMSEFSAAMGLTNLESFEEFIRINRRNFLLYQQELEGLSGVRMVTHECPHRCNYQYVVLEVDEDAAGITRDDLLRVLHAENVIARRYFYPGCHNMQPYRSLFPSVRLDLPNTERICNRVLVLPTGSAVGEADVVRVSRLIALAVNNASALSRRLRESADG